MYKRHMYALCRDLQQPSLLAHTQTQILCGGENVYCTEVEAVLSAHPAVAAAAVFGIPHPLLGELVAAAVTLRQPQPGGVEQGGPLQQQGVRQQLTAWCRQRLAHYKVPSQVSLHTARA